MRSVQKQKKNLDQVHQTTSKDSSSPNSSNHHSNQYSKGERRNWKGSAS